MSSISGISGASNGWATNQASRQQHQQRMFSKVDSDGSGGVSASEFDNMMSNVSSKTGASLGDSSEMFSKMDSDGDGSLTSGELGNGMKSAMKSQMSTMAFSQSREAGMPAMGGMPPNPLLAEAAGSTESASSAQATDSAEESTTYDALDTDQDGTVSEMERLAGTLKELSQSDSGDGDGLNAEIARLAQKLYEQISSESLSGVSGAQVSVSA